MLKASTAIKPPYLTKAKPGAKGEGRAFANIEEVLMALDAGEVETLSPIRLRYSGELPHV